MAIQPVSLDISPFQFCDVRELTIGSALSGQELDRLNAIVSVVQLVPHSTETVSRTFSQFEREGAIRSERGQVVIERGEALEELAGR